MISISKNVYIDKLDDIVNEYSNAYHRTIKMTSHDVKSSAYFEFNVETNDKDPIFEDCDHVRLSKRLLIFAKAYTPNWSEEVFVIKKVEDAVPWTSVIGRL